MDIRLNITLNIPEEVTDLIERLVTVLEDEYEQKYIGCLPKEEDNEDND